uniref:Uncharacterized protein n=1 Tax=Siphoviridae sp. ctYJD4 TaxID=2826375 RepID=A0A8S5N0J7_9CAUD|nr:MAG TPA: hypothetical protein [Siphoviridae sp. ctYJD4]
MYLLSNLQAIAYLLSCFCFLPIILKVRHLHIRLQND